MFPVQEQILKLLVEVDQICRENQIEYYLTGGTALGAVRHGGFLPWDDDADVYITRKNYLKLIEVMRTGIRPDREFLCAELNPNFPYPYARYMDRNTTAIYRSYSLGFGGAGISVDFVLLDNLPNDEKSRVELIERYRALYEYTVDYYTLTRKSSYKRYRENIKKARMIGRQKFIEREKQAIYLKYTDEECDCYFQNLPFWTHILPKWIFGKPTYVKFENTYLPVAEHVTDYLRIGYGDDWYMIPEKTEIRTHITTNNINIGYQNYFNDYLRFVDVDAVQKNNKRQKFYDMQINEIASQTDLMNLEMLSYALQLDLIEKKREIALDLNQTLQNGSYDILKALYTPYYNLQLGKVALYWEYYVDLPEDDFFAAIYTLLIQGDYGKARKILQIKHAHHGKSSEKIEELKELTEEIRNMSIHFERGEIDKAEKIFLANFEKNQNIIDFIRAKVRLDVYNKRSTTNELRYAEDQAKAYPMDGEIRKYYGDLLALSGEDNKARREYRLAARRSNNGMLLKQLSEMGISVKREWTNAKDESPLRQVKTQRDLSEVIEYLHKDIANGLYMYIDMSVYGLKHPKLKIWEQRSKLGDIQLIVMMYYDSIQLFSLLDHAEQLDLENTARLIEKIKPAMISGRLDIINHLLCFLDDSYNLTSGYVYQLDSYREIDDKGLVSMASPEDAREIAELICMDNSTFAHCDVDNLTQQFRERMETHMGRSYIIRENGKIIAHNATYAEYNGIAVGSGLMIHPLYRNRLYDAIIDSYQIHDLMREGVRLYTFLTNPSRVKLFQVMGNKECGRYGKLTIKHDGIGRNNNETRGEK